MNIEAKRLILALISIMLFHKLLAVSTAENSTEITTTSRNETAMIRNPTTVEPQLACKPEKANEFVDAFLKTLQKQMPKLVPLPDVEQYFFQLVDGYMKNMTLKRNGDAKLECGLGFARLIIPFTTTQPMGTYYVWKHRLLPLVSGSSTSQVSAIKGQMVLTFKTAERLAKVDGIEVSDLGKLDIRVQLGLNSVVIPNIFSMVTSQVTNVLTTFLKPFLQSKIGGILTNAFNRILPNMKL